MQKTVSVTNPPHAMSYIGIWVRRRTWLAACLLTGIVASSAIWAAPEVSVPAPASASSDGDTSLTQEGVQRALAAVKADYLYQFLGYVEFAKSVLPQPDSPLTIGVIGADDVFNALGDVLPMRTINNRSVWRKRLTEGDSLAGVHLLFVGKKIDLLQSALVKAARASSILLVTDAPNGLNAGAIFNFLVSGEHLRFEASLEAADRASVKISSRVLTLAEHVIGVR